MKNFTSCFANLFWEKINTNNYDKIIFLCIGTDRVIGDCFGPLVGEKLKELMNNQKKIKIFGSLNEVICINDIKNVMNKILDNFENPFIIVVDAALDIKENIGEVFVSNDGIKVGSGLNKKNMKIGEISIKGVVSYNTGVEKYNFRLLQNINLSLIFEMARLTANSIYEVINV